MKRVAIFLAMVVALATQALPVSAVSPVLQPVTQTAAGCTSNSVSNFFSFRPWYACLPTDASGAPKIEKLTDIFKIIFPIVDSLVKASVLVAATFMFYMLFNIVMARGDSGKIASAINGIRDAVIGLIIALVAVGIVNFVSGAFI